ncbi:MAG TPA: primosomal protein N' [Gammaproteobacteria bacterium]|nr:primosomal protein N' [Gammaproteobacteria bacterium]
MPSREPILRVALAAPLYRCFDYLPPARADGSVPEPGTRVRVPFGRSRAVGVLVEVAHRSRVPVESLKRALAVLDERPVLDADVLAMARWAAEYYRHPPGEVLAAALPVALRRGEPARMRLPVHWALTAAGRALGPGEPVRAPRQARLVQRLREAPGGLSATAIHEEPGNWRHALHALRRKGLVASVPGPRHEPGTGCGNPEAPPAPGPGQHAAIDAIREALGQFACFLLEGVTGSGKTEVYLRCVERVLERGGQALILVPEIGLTPQLIDRFRRRFGVPMSVLHSGLTDRERLDAWLRAREGRAGIVIGTRSAVFVPLARPGLIVVDEEHDLSFKQQEGFRYSARDLAVWRARHCGIPAVLGSATPSLESLANARTGRYRRLSLPHRAGRAAEPELRLLDVRAVPLEEGLSPRLLQAVQRHLDQGTQVLVFLNRRGFAPTLLCHACGWVSRCERCDARLTLHRRTGGSRLLCHHCGATRPALHACPECGGELVALGQGTERVASALEERFPGAGVLRIDRDSTQRRGSMQELLEEAHTGRSRILLGTQMLAKGHHFPEVTLAAIVDADQGLFGADFRAPERMAQLITQVAGRAGRAGRPGEVLIQTHHPEHPLLRTLLREGYGAFARMALEERRAATLPPYSRLALLRAEAPRREPPPRFLEAALELARQHAADDVFLLGPVPAPMERRAGRYRYQLLVQAPDHQRMQGLLRPWVPKLAEHPLARRVRWSIDVDPAEMY